MVQGEIGTLLSAGIITTMPQSTANATATPPDVITTFQETEQVLSSYAPAHPPGVPSSTHQAGIQPSTVQGEIEAMLSADIITTIPHFTTNATATPPNVIIPFQETEQVLHSHTPMHPSGVSDWLQSFCEWLPIRQPIMSAQGLGNPLLCPSLWVQCFDNWYQLLLSRKGFDDLSVLSRPWNDIFDTWLQRILKQELGTFHDAPPRASVSTGSSLSSASPSATSNSPDMDSSDSTSTIKPLKRPPITESKLTVREIQEACRRNGAEENVIARIAVMFPDIVTREQLKVAGQRRKRNHEGYMEFAERCIIPLKNVKRRTRGTGGTGVDQGVGQVPRYQCRLCGRVKRPRWKNSKDLLHHVWDKHCAPQGDGIFSCHPEAHTADNLIQLNDSLLGGDCFGMIHFLGFSSGGIFEFCLISTVVYSLLGMKRYITNLQ